jgi:flagellar L-ring protein precursor FlgH
MGRSAAFVAVVCVAVWLAARPGIAVAEQQKVVKTSDNYEELYARYLEAARATRPGAGPPAASDWMTRLVQDSRARSVNDLVTVRVVESIEAVGTADSQLTKNSAGSASITNLFGLESEYPDWLNPDPMVSTTSDTKFKGGGTTTRSGELTAVMTARVIEVLPNGDLVLEGAREIDINGDRQIVVLTGVVRAVDIDRNNSVLSTRIGQLQIRYFGRGLIKDNLRPGWLIRVLNKIF